MGCSCNQANVTWYVVKYPDGSTKEVNSEVSARAEMSKVPGTSYRKKS